MAISYIISEIKRDIGRRQQFFHAPYYITTVGKTVANIFVLFFFHNRPMAYQEVYKDIAKKSFVYSKLKRTLDRQTDGKAI